jgi:conjugal transfer/entry exclusion protein
MINNLWAVASYISTFEVLQLLFVGYCENIRVYEYSLHNLKKLKHSIWRQLANISQENANISQEVHYMFKKIQKVWGLLKRDMHLRIFFIIT